MFLRGKEKRSEGDQSIIGARLLQAENTVAA